MLCFKNEPIHEARPRLTTVEQLANTIYARNSRRESLLFAKGTGPSRTKKFGSSARDGSTLERKRQLWPKPSVNTWPPRKLLLYVAKNAHS